MRKQHFTFDLIWGWSMFFVPTVGKCKTTVFNTTLWNKHKICIDHSMCVYIYICRYFLYIHVYCCNIYIRMYAHMYVLYIIYTCTLTYGHGRCSWIFHVFFGNVPLAEGTPGLAQPSPHLPQGAWVVQRSHPIGSVSGRFLVTGRTGFWISEPNVVMILIHNQKNPILYSFVTDLKVSRTDSTRPLDVLLGTLGHQMTLPVFRCLRNSPIFVEPSPAVACSAIDIPLLNTID